MKQAGVAAFPALHTGAQDLGHGPIAQSPWLCFPGFLALSLTWVHGHGPDLGNGPWSAQDRFPGLREGVCLYCRYRGSGLSGQ